MIWDELKREPLFLLGVSLKLALVLFLVPEIQREWFVPFVVHWMENPLTIPWESFIYSGGDSLAFPYGPTMLFVHLPTTWLGWLVDSALEVNYFALLGFRVSLMLTDMVLLLLLLQYFEQYWKGILLYYWLSPLMLFITYWHGQTDLVPLVFLMSALLLIRQRQYEWAGLLLALSITAKHSMLLGLPFILIYLWTNRSVRHELRRLLYVLIPVALLLEGGLFGMEGFQQMVLANREVGKLFWLSVDVGDVEVYLTPLLYLLLLYSFWRMPRVNFDLLWVMLGVGFGIIIIMTSSPPGWLLWILPVLVLHQCKLGQRAVLLLSIYSFFFISFHLLNSSGSMLYPLMWTPDLAGLVEGQLRSLHYTLLVALGSLIVLQMIREGIRSNDYYRLGRKPLVIGITGDVESGRQLFSAHLTSLFGLYRTVEVAGEDYRRWHEGSSMWSRISPFHPKANRLFQLVSDVRNQIRSGILRVRKQVILVVANFALYPRQLSKELDVGFFIAKDSLLTVSEVNGVDSEGDYSVYIEPQAERADVVFSLHPVNSELVDREHGPGRLMLRTLIRNGAFYHELVRVLVGVCGLNVNADEIDEKGEVLLEISGELAAEDVELALAVLLPHQDELLDGGATFVGGMEGVMLIIAMMEIDEALRRRRVSV